MPTKIEWCNETLNPFWGCTHGCPYCQARRIAHMRAERIGRLRGYPSKVIAKMKRFEPVWLPDADRILDAPRKWKKPRTIFIGFMGDIAYQDEISKTKIFRMADRFPQHRFLLLSKAALKLWWVGMPKNVWVGGSVTFAADMYNGFVASGAPILRHKRPSYISFEPVIGDVINGENIGIASGIPYNCRWFIIGALTDRRGQPVAPEKGGTRLEWVLPIIEQADKYRIPVFLKNNLLKLYPQLPKRQEFPWA